jgi:4-hydroxy-2-oxoheptanedioate aldolase
MDFRMKNRKENGLLKKLKQNKVVYGTWSMTGSTTVVEVLANTGLDYIILDMEHASISFETIENQVRACELHNVQAIIRLSTCDEQLILRALETGCRGIMVPHITTKEDAIKVAKACKYAPQGTRGLSPYTRNHIFTHDNLQNSLEDENNNTFVGILVEGSEGINNLSEIADVDGIDLIYTGIYDISQSIGLTGELTHPKVLELQKKCVSIVNNGNGSAIAGSFAKDIEYVKTLKDNGFKFIAFSADGYILKKAYQEALEKF